MYLKRLELYGFKTFATRTVLDFEGGVTAVVGPNGSGKSNLADAVRWALGEQSLRLVRCHQAADLIFAGTARHGARGSARAPLDMAEVMVTFDNSAGWLPIDFQEVRIGRRVYRTGENEYLMNGARVRLRDITDLLARASISTGGHLVIGQGLIDTVLGLRPEERRTLIETLAGLRFYYGRREDAEAKLRATEANLHSVDAMIAEGAPHLAILQEQAATYARYHAVERELRDALLLHYAHAHARALEKWERLADELRAAQKALDAETAAVRQSEGELAEVRASARDLLREVEELRRAVRGAHETREAAERALAVSQARRDAALARLEDLQRDLPTLEARRAESQAELARAVEAASAVEAERVRLQREREVVDRAVHAATAEAVTVEREARALADRRRALEAQEAAAAAELAALDREEEAARGEEGRYAAEEEATARGLREASAAVTAALHALDAASTRVEDARSGEARARGQATEATAQARRAGDERRGHERRVDELRARADALRTWLATMGGATYGATQPGHTDKRPPRPGNPPHTAPGRGAHAGSGGAAGQGVHADLTVAATLLAAPEIGPALAAALGPALTARLAAPNTDESAAAAALATGARGLLVPGRTGLTTTTQEALRHGIDAAGVPRDWVIGWGDGLARVEGGGQDVAAVRAALSSVLVVRDLEALWRVHGLLCRVQEQETAAVVLATLGGEALLPNGLLHRPAGEGAMALEQARALRRVEREMAAAETALREAVTAEEHAEAERLRGVTAAEAALRALRAAEHERNTCRGDLTAAERAEARARHEAQWAVERGQRATAARAARSRRRTELTGRRDEVRAGLAALATDERPLATRYEATRAAVQGATARRAEHGAALALIAERAGDAARRRHAAEETLARLDGDLRARMEAVARLDRETHELERSTDASLSGATEAAKRLEALHARLRPLEQELATLNERGAELERRLEILRPRAVRAATAHEEAALARQRAEHERESVLAGLQADLALDPVDLPPVAPLPPGLGGRIKALRAQLALFGPVNARAPADLAAATEHQGFLQAQATDLREGTARLRELIAEANATVRERFGSVTGELDAQFRLYLQQLFGGGHGELTALYDAAGLPSGLDIHVQPPGKRTSDLALLSGGERALVGLALVFAMLAVRPIPFCVLDEAEAALDESNTLRVGEILRALSARTQFLVITHNRGTMSHADALYGVTMAASGISQVAGLRLDDVEVVRRSRAG